MRQLRFTLFILGFALVAIPASATITYCSSGCNVTGSSYASMPSTNGNGGLSYSSLITFASGNLGGSPAIYTDPTTGGVFYGYYGGSNTTPDSLAVSGSQLVQTNGGQNTSVELVLPANTYAIAMVVGESAFTQPFIELVSSPSNLNTTTNDLFQLTISNSSSPQFFGIVSDTPISSVFVWNGAPGGTLNIQSFEMGQESGGGSATPEAATFFTMGGGLIGLYFLRRRRFDAILRPLGLLRPRASHA